MHNMLLLTSWTLLVKEIGRKKKILNILKTITEKNDQEICQYLFKDVFQFLPGMFHPKTITFGFFHRSERIISSCFLLFYYVCVYSIDISSSKPFSNHEELDVNIMEKMCPFYLCIKMANDRGSEGRKDSHLVTQITSPTRIKMTH